MSICDIPKWQLAQKASSQRHDPNDTGHADFWQRGLSRRQFARTAVGTAAVGTTLASGMWRPGLVEAKRRGESEPVPIPGGTPILGGGFHVFGPNSDGSFDPIDAEPSTITNFNGFVGLAYISGTVTRTNTTTGEVRILPFVNNDMRFMQGVFKDKDGRTNKGAFAFVWVDVYEPGPGSQIHDLNPSAFPPTRLFWTLEVPRDSIRVHLGKGVAIMQEDNLPILDYGSIPNALFTGNAPVPTPGIVSFKVKWSGRNEPVKIRNTDPIYGGFAGRFFRNTAQMEWTATVGNYTFVSAPLETSFSSFAEMGHERNGSFFSQGDEKDDDQEDSDSESN